MPVYILHGFRWPRAGFKGIRVYIIVNNLDDAAAEYIQTPHSRDALLESFKKTHPDIMAELPVENLMFIEQHDPEDVTSDAAVTQPYAYFADKVITMALPGEPAPQAQKEEEVISEGGVARRTPHDLSINVEDIIAEGAGLSAKGWDAFADLRDQIAPGEKIGWWIVYNGDPDRSFDDFSDEDEYDEDYGENLEQERISEAQEVTTKSSKPPTPLIVKPRDHLELSYRAASPQQTPETIRRKALPVPITKTTPFEDQKSPLKEAGPAMNTPRDSPTPTPEKRLPPIPPPKPSRFPARPKTPIKPDILTKKLFGRKSST